MNSFFRRIEELDKYGGIKGVAKALHTSLEDGLPDLGDEKERSEVFGRNVYPEPPMKGFIKLWVEAISDTTLIILICAAIVSLILGLAVGGTSTTALSDCTDTTATIEQDEDDSLEWIEGTAILMAVAVVSLVTAGNDYSKELKFRALAKEEKNVPVKVLRGGKENVVSINNLLVGDIVALDTGDQIPADGLFVSGFELKCDESQMTGESDMVKKSSTAPFMLSGVLCSFVQ
jgi:Ca2+ transporting ATPase